MKRLFVPDPVGWDFRGVQPEALADAALYEYARTTGSIREAARRWLDTHKAGTTIRVLLTEASRTKNQKACEAAMRGEWRAASKAFRNARLLDIVTLIRPDFPAPWLANAPGVAPLPGFSRIQVVPLANVICRQRDDLTVSALNLFHRDAFLVSIRWEHANQKEIVADFEKWLHREAKNHADELRPRGQAGQLQLAPLKDLAALRLSNAGLTFPQVKSALDCYLDPKNPQKRRDALGAGVDPRMIPQPLPDTNATGKGASLPIYRNKSGFSDAIARAKRKLKELEKGIWKVGF